MIVKLFGHLPCVRFYAKCLLYIPHVFYQHEQQGGGWNEKQSQSQPQ